MLSLVVFIIQMGIKLIFKNNTKKQKEFLDAIQKHVDDCRNSVILHDSYKDQVEDLKKEVSNAK